MVAQIDYHTMTQRLNRYFANCMKTEKERRKKKQKEDIQRDARLILSHFC
jgi:hypothetical protein